jgi:hypothetical protein
MSQDEVTALADCVGILLDDIRKNKTRSTALLVEGDAVNRAGDSGTQKTAPADDVSIPHG